MTSSQIKSDLADPILYRLYFKLCLADILDELGFEATQKNKEILHDFHKRVLGYETIAGRSQEVLSRFIQDVCLFWAERGIFVRTSGRQPKDIASRDFNEIKHLL